VSAAPASHALVGGVELGGSKAVCVVGAGREIFAEERLPLGESSATLAAVTSFFTRQRARGRTISALGIASFGPLELREAHPDFGRITTTPKPGWSRVDLVRPLREALGVPTVLDTDVNAAALAEGRFGAARGCGNLVYLTVGTGIGAGAIVGGRTLHGLTHTEMGHVAVIRADGDSYPGRCPFHGDCLEGMASGPAIEARFGQRAETLEGEGRDAAAGVVAFYLAAALRGIVFTLAPERIVLGGGLSQLPGLVVRVRRAFARQVANYPALPEHQDGRFVVAAKLGQSAGPAGALWLAEVAANRSPPTNRGGRPA
jgi:fructokinase